MTDQACKAIRGRTHTVCGRKVNHWADYCDRCVAESKRRNPTVHGVPKRGLRKAARA